MNCEWTPLIRVGPLEFGANIGPLVEEGVVIPLEYDDDSTGWETYAYGGDAVCVHVDDGRIVSVACYQQCLLRSRNLIGLDFASAVELIGFSPSCEPDIILIDEEPQQVFEIEEVEAQLWVKDGIVVTVFCSGIDDE
jgi:hypothetical protein